MSNLLNESSMTVPIAEYLAAKYGREVQSEKDHPYFASEHGRPKQIDFVREKRGSENWHAAYECKFQTQSFHSIVNDICRLALLAQVAGVGSPHRYFIYAAKIAEDDTVLSNRFNTGCGDRLPYFDPIFLREADDVGESNEFYLRNLHRKQLEAFRSFAKTNRVALPSGLKTTLVGWSATRSYKCLIWRITSLQGSVLLKRKDLRV